MTADEMYTAGRQLEASGNVGDSPEVERSYRKAAAAGSVEAMSRLGLLLEGRVQAQLEGRSEYSGDFVEADSWYRKAADRGDTWAAFALGRLYADKFNDWNAAVPWFSKAAAQQQPGHWQAKERLQQGPAGVERRRADARYLDELGDRASSRSGTGGGSGGCMVAAILLVLPEMLALLSLPGYFA
ncbi:hypothetical protein OOZ19_20600 [Saccharopolyspora sp. NFXS83]|uniref:tetratricopeptide repeat protein n=1 Tax=Saccharopolyspora sp. NFXS83 TaxID=2993560 RepID=UPI00224A952C|nr:hypothetical protein [Saccharopolyspora sp. NFXS83]MCX2732643.1 hypothetical protein [Saccharopolyspora sp. NFXS83]